MHSVRGRGFMALISTCIIAAALVAAVLGVYGAGFVLTSAIAGSEYKHIARAHAHACMHAALLDLALYGTVTPRTLQIGTDEQDQCVIDSVLQKPDAWYMTVHAERSHSFVALYIEATTTPTVQVITVHEE